MRIRLIQPKMGMRPMDTDLKNRMSPPLGLYTIAQLLRDEHDIEVVNENIRPLRAPAAEDEQPDLVGISVTVDTLPRAVEIAAAFRARGIAVVAGGIHISTATHYVPEGAFDALCIGPAELTWPRIVRDAAAGQLRSIYRAERPLCSRDIVSPAYDMISQDDYLYCNILHASRGCPFRCDFCYNSSDAHRFVTREIEDVLRDIRALGSRHVMFIDDNFIGNPAYTRRLLAAMKPLGLKWNAAVSANIATMPDLLDEMRDCGCQSLFIGFESIQPDSIASVHKVQNATEQYDALIEAVHSRGIMINASFVFGLDSDTPETFAKTLEWIVARRIETVTSHILTPYPGTVIYESMKAQNRLTSEDLSLYNTAHVVFAPSQMTAEQLREGYLWIYRELYSFKNIWRRMPRARGQILPYLAFNFCYRKFGFVFNALSRMITYRALGRWAQRWSLYVSKK